MGHPSSPLEAQPVRLFLYLPAPFDTQEEILRRVVHPLFRRLAGEPGVGSISFARSGDPDPLIRVLLAGEPPWIAERARPILDEAASSGNGSVHEQRELPGFEAEIRRWGGSAGALLAERTFAADSVACLERLELEARGECGRTRREWSLLLTEGLLDLLRFDRRERLEFYRRGHRWPVARGAWQEEDLRVLETKYRSVRAGLAALLRLRAGSSGEALWGGGASAAVAERWLTRLAPVAADWIEAREQGRIDVDWTELVWSLAHVHALRLGIDPIPEAILRFFVYRSIEDGTDA